MFFNKASDTWDCSQCNAQRANHETPYWRIRRVPNTRGNRFALYGDEETAVVSQTMSRSDKVSAWCSDMKEATSRLSGSSDDSPRDEVPKEPSMDDMRAYIMEAVANAPDRVAAIARFCGVRGGMRLANTPQKLRDELHLFFNIVDPFVKNADNKDRPWDQDRIAASLKSIGVLRADGDDEINNSNISNTIRKAVFGRGPSCFKPGYQGKNWLSFQ